MQRINQEGKTEGYGGVAIEPHKLEGGKRKGKSMKKKAIRRKGAFVTVKQAKAALLIDPNAKYDPKTKCLIYNRKVGE